MKKRIDLSRPTRLLIVANVVLALIVSAELALPAGPAAANAVIADNEHSSLPEFGDTNISAPPVSQLLDMVERPLFYIDRRMPQPEVASTAPPAPLRLKLEGIAIAGGARVAVLRNQNGNSLVQLAEGDLHDGWTLDVLTSTSATFSRNGEQSTELLLDPVSNSRRQ